MSPKSLYLFVSLIFINSLLFCQNFDLNATRVLDSLNKELVFAKYDSTKIKLRIKIGQVARIKRTGYWDSIITQADKLQLDFYKGIGILKLGAIFYLEQRDLDTALYCYRKSLKLLEKTQEKGWILDAYLSLTGLQMYRSDFKSALEYAYTGLQKSETFRDDKRTATFHSRLGTIYFFLNDPQKALMHHLLAIAAYEKVKANRLIAESLCDVFADYEKLRDTSNFIKYALKTTNYLPILGETPEAINVLNTLGTVYIYKKLYDSADYFALKAYQLADKLNYSEAKAGALNTQSHISYSKEEYGKAKTQALASLKICKEINFLVQIPTLALLLKKICLKNNDYKGALEAQELFMTIRDSLSNEQNRKMGAQKEFDYQIEKKVNENKLLAQQNQIQSLELRQNSYLLTGFGILLLLGALIGHLFFRQNKIRSEQQRSWLEQKLLRSQMNPHFIFNSLQAIQNYILKHDEKEAITYLNSFASVTRNVLENSRMDLIPLKKEISLLENYLQLQKLRFKNRFNYQIKIDETIDSEHINIPPMLAQPFIENAVEHGFHNIADGKITVSYAVKNSVLYMEITDNGTGMKDGYSQNKQHRSLALEITRERVALMNKKAKEKVLFTITEAFPLESERKGVKVNFSLPLNLLGE